MYDMTLNIHIISRRTHTFYAREMKKINLTMGQFPFLLGIAQCDGISQENLSSELRISKSTTAMIVQQLLEKGYISREIDENDRRNFRLHITDAGKQLIPHIRRIIRGCHKKIMQDFTAQEKSQFLVQLDTLRKRTEQELKIQADLDENE